MKTIVATVLALLTSFSVIAGGNPEFVGFPVNYKADFNLYDMRNRMNGKQLAILYANEDAVSSAEAGTLGNGSKVVMEVYKVVMDAEGKPKVDDNGLFVKSDLAAIAVMEKNSNWSKDFMDKDKAGEWGFALYQQNGSPKENDLPCATCHKPLKEQDYRFSADALKNFAARM